MNTIELSKTMEVLGIDISSTTYNGLNTYSWLGFEFSFYNYYTVVNGRVPLELAKEIYNKYPNNIYLIRVDGKHETKEPTEFGSTSSDRERINAASSYNEVASIIKNAKKLEEKGIYHDMDSRYINTYHIDTKEGLVVLITELQDYYAKKLNNGKIENSQVDKQKEIIGQINKELIESSNPQITTDQWMTINNVDIFERTKNNKNVTEQDLEIRSLLEQYDMTINPFTNDNLVEPQEYSDKIMFECAFNEKGALRIGFSEKEKIMNIELGHIRSDRFLIYSQCYHEEPNRNVEIRHSYDIKNQNSNQSEENISIDINLVGNDRYNIKYNLITGLIESNNGEKLSITSEQKNFIIQELTKAIEIAQNLTTKNMIAPISNNTLVKK